MKFFKSLCQLSLVALVAAQLSACGLFGDKDNTPKPAPLVKFKQTLPVHELWSQSVGNGNNGKFLRLHVAADNGVLYTAGNGGNISAVNAKTGNLLWQVNVNAPISAGAAAGSNTVVVGTSRAHVIAVSEKNGTLLWNKKISGVVLAPPTIHGNSVYIKSIDGKLYALNIKTGKQRWVFNQDVPSLILRGSGSATVADDQVIAGFANGNIVALASDTGDSNWTQPIAATLGYNDIENMIDIDAKPIVSDGVVYAASYQGNIAALNTTTGTPLWMHAFSSYAGLNIDSNAVYASDADSHVWAFDQETGGILWHQNALAWRTITAPVALKNSIAVADKEGYVHWLAKKDGSFVARRSVGSAVLATPLAIGNDLYVLSVDGTLTAYQIG